MWLWSNSIDFISEGIQFGGSSHLQQDWVGMDFLQQVKEAWAIIVFFYYFLPRQKKVKEKHTQVSHFWVLLNIEHTPPTQLFSPTLILWDFFTAVLYWKNFIQFLLHPCLKWDIGAHSTVAIWYACEDIYGKIKTWWL